MNFLYEKYSTEIFLISCLSILLFAALSVILYRTIYNFENIEEQNVIFSRFQILFLLIHFKFDFSKLLRYLCNYSKERGYLYLKVFNKYFIFLSHPNPIQIILNDKENIERPFLKRGIKGLIDKSLLLSNGEEWKILKNLMNPFFQQSNLERYLSTIEYNSKLLVEELFKKNKKWLFITSIISYHTFKISSETIFGYPKDSTPKIFFSIYSENFNNISKHFWNRIFNIFIWNDLIFNLTPSGKSFFKSINIIRTNLEKVIDERSEVINERMKNKDVEADFNTVGGIADYYLFTYKSNPYITKEYLIDETIELLIAAEHTLTKTISLVLYCIGRHPDIQKKVHYELDSVFHAKNNDCISTNLIKLKYLACVIKETMRLYPLIPITLRTSKTEYHFSGNCIPKNAFIIISIYDLHRNPNVYSCPDTFDPERHMSDDSLNEGSFSFIPFGKGIRTCIGFRYAMMVIKITVLYIMRNFYVESYPEDLTIISNAIFLETEEAIKIKLKPRQI